MKARHLKVEADTALYKLISNRLRNELPFNKRKANLYFILKALFYCSIGAISYYLVFIIHNPILFILNFILFGFVAVLLCFNFAHDLSHHSVIKKLFWDNFFFEFIYTLVGAHPEAWKNRHVHSHHFAPNVEHFDTDLAITGLIRVLPNSDVKWYHQYQHLYAPLAYMSYSFYWVFIKDFLVLNKFSPKDSLQKGRYYLTFIFLKAFYLIYIIVLPLVYSNQKVWVVILAFLLMHMVQSLYTLFTFFITHHVDESHYPTADKDGEINTSWFKNQVASSNDFYPFSNLANFIFGGVNNHIAHHLFPHINHFYYPEVNRILYQELISNGIVPNRSSYLGGVYSHLKLLKLRGRGASV